jgi:hypothetical protein
VIDRIAIRNFKAFERQSTALRPITVLVGPNNSGKSSLLAPLRLLSQTLQSLDYQAPLLLNGPFGEFGTYRDVVHLNHRGKPLSITMWLVETRASQRNWRAAASRRSQSKEPPDSLWAPTGQKLKLSLTFKYRTQRRELILRDVDLQEGSRHLVSLTYSEEANRHMISKIASRPVLPQQQTSLRTLVRLQHFLPRLSPLGLARSPDQSPLFDDDEENLVQRLLRDTRYSIQPFVGTFEGIEYIGAMRSPPARTYQHAGETHAHIGAAGDNWANAVVMDSARRRARGRVTPNVIDWMRSAGLASDLRVNWLDDRHYEIQVRHPVSGEYENIADVGQGNSQVIPVIVGGFQLEPGSTFIVEEPEIHLHPRAQAELGTFFLGLYGRGIQSLVETHSEYLVLRLQQHVAAGDIDPNDVAFYYVDATPSGKKVTLLTLDASGTFTEGLPGGFFPERLEESKRLARIRAKHGS